MKPRDPHTGIPEGKSVCWRSTLIIVSLLLVAVIFILSCVDLEFTWNKTRLKRSFLDNCKLIETYTNKTCKQFYGYGCFCGLGSRGKKPLDSIDQCCFDHDLCYGSINCNLLYLPLTHYTYHCYTHYCACTDNPRYCPSIVYTPDTLHLTTTFNYSLQTPQQTSVSTNNTETDTSLFQEESGNLSLVLSTTEAVGNVTEIPQQDALDDNDQVMYVNNLTETASKKVVENSNKNDTEEKCSGYLPDESNAHQFQVFAFERWVTQKCHYGLIWNQDLCQCDWAPGHQFFSPTEEGGCDLTLNITFDESIIRDYAKNAFISVEQKVEIRPANRNEREDNLVKNPSSVSQIILPIIFGITPFTTPPPPPPRICFTSLYVTRICKTLQIHIQANKEKIINI
ncbi:basic phospholipase A2-like [Octopus vulgaris]|uniref:phospholipase A2 n=1 Tax=Octopus vulgaris TaxID=6645 RepID=A0AA36FH37_OCTVU|nr:basic phospholipase A2-like [Octopus vulgaris]